MIMLSKWYRSFQRNKGGILGIILAALFTATGQLLWKLSNGSINTALIFGFILYGLGAVTMIISFKFGRFSVLHPFLSLGYVFAIFYGTFFLHEPMTRKVIIGIIIIIIGSILIGGSDDDE